MTKRSPSKAPRPNGGTHTTDLNVTRCPHCKHATMTGWSNGLHITLDPTPLTAIGEQAVIGLGLATYLRSNARARRRLEWHLAQPFPDDLRTVHTTHRCGKPIGLALARHMTVHTTRVDFPTNPPY